MWMMPRMTGSFLPVKGRLRRKSRGTTLLEALLTAGITAFVLILATGALLRGLDDVRDQTAAQHFKTVQNAAVAFLTDNYAALQANPRAITMAELSNNSQYLPASFANTNPYGDSYTIQVTRNPTSPDILELAVYTIQQGGRTNRVNVRAPSIAARIGPEAGAVVTVGGTTSVQGTYGGWAIADPTTFNINTQAGQVVSLQAFDERGLIGDYLQRTANATNPSANRMDTNLDMRRNDLANVATLNTTDMNTSTGMYAESITAGNVDIGRSGDTSGQILANDVLASNSAGRSGQIVFSGTGATPTNVVLDADQVATLDELDTRVCAANEYITRTGSNARGMRFACAPNVILPGTVLAYNQDSCPDGWQRYVPADGRMIVGTGIDTATARTYNLAQQGGAASRFVTLENLPSNIWMLGRTTTAVAPGGGNPINTVAAIRPGGSSGYAPIDTTTDHVALSYCVRNASAAAVATAPPAAGCTAGTWDNSDFSATGTGGALVNVPIGCGRVTLEAWGAGGGSGSRNSNAGPGGYASLTVNTISAARSFRVFIGQKGMLAAGGSSVYPGGAGGCGNNGSTGAGSASGGSGGPGGQSGFRRGYPGGNGRFGGGGGGGADAGTRYCGGTGGGASVIREASTDLVIGSGGGGGGARNDSNGGTGGAGGRGCGGSGAAGGTQNNNRRGGAGGGAGVCVGLAQGTGSPANTDGRVRITWAP